MAQYALPAYNPGNRMLDFSQFNEGMDALGQSIKQGNRLAQDQEIGRDLAAKNYQGASATAYKHGRLDTGLAIDKTRISNEEMQRQRERQQVEWFGAKAKAVLAEQDPNKRAAIWQNIISRHPDRQSLGPEFLDPNQGPQLVAAEAGQYFDNLDRQLKQSQLAASGLQQQATRLEIQSKQRELDSPKGTLTELDPNKSLIYTDPRTGQSRVLQGPQPTGGFKDGKQRADVEEGYRKEYASLAKPYFDVRDAYTRVEQSARAPSAAGDLALIFNYMKMLDPGSVVREGEFATAQNAAGIPERIRAQWNRVVNGERLTDETRNDFVGQARGLFKAQEAQYANIQRQYSEIAKRNGIDPRNVILDHGRVVNNAGNVGEGGQQAKFRARNAEGVVIESDDGINWRQAR